MFCSAKHVFAFRSETLFYHRWFARYARRGLAGSARTRRLFEKGGRKLHSLAIAATAAENFIFFAMPSQK